MWGVVGGAVAAIAVLYAVLNVAAWGLVRLFPSLLISPNERLRLEYLDRFKGELAPYTESWFGLQPGEWEAFFAEYKRGEAGIHIQEDYTELRHGELQGKFLNYSEHGFRCGREQGAWPPDPAFCNVFFFGGSTALGVGPDWTTVPSYLQEALNRDPAPARPIRVYNFGRGSYLSTQERILFQQLLAQGHVPDVAIFLDGLNDFFFLDGRPATHGIYAQAMEETNRRQHDQRRNVLRARPQWSLLSDFLGSLPLHQLADALAKRFGSTEVAGAPIDVKSEPIPEPVLDAVIERWDHNRRQVLAVAQEYGVRTFFVWQPVPAYGYDLEHHVALHVHYGLHGHSRSGPGYARMAEWLKERPPADDFLWLGDLQRDRKEPLYVDSVHYTAEFSDTVARAIAQGLRERKLVPVA